MNNVNERGVQEGKAVHSASSDGGGRREQEARESRYYQRLRRSITTRSDRAKGTLDDRLDRAFEPNLCYFTGQ